MQSSFAATLHLEGRTYAVSACWFGFYQPTDHRGRPRSRVRTQPIYLLLYPTDGQAEQPLRHWALNSYKLLSGKLVFARADNPDGALKYLWFTNARAELSEQFDATGAGPGAALQLWLRIWAEEAGVEPGSGGEWVAPPAREYRAPEVEQTSFHEGEQTPLNVTELPDSDELDNLLHPSLLAMLGTSLLIERASYDDEGLDPFEERVKADLHHLYSTSTGRILLDSLHASGKTATIQYALDGINRAFIPKDKVNLCRYQEDGVTPGAGTSIQIAYNPSLETLGEEAWQTRPAAIALAHEIIHAEQAAYGRMRRGTTDNPGRPSKIDPKKFQQVPIMELETVGIPPYDTYHVNENKIRSEWKPPQILRNRY